MPRGRPRKATTVTPTNTAQGLIDALKFIALVRDENDQHAADAHCLLVGKWAAATNGVVSVGCPIPEDISGAPDTGELIHALERCGSIFNIVKNGYTMEVASEKFKAVLDMIDPTHIIMPPLDNPVAPIDNRLIEGFAALSPIVADKHDKIMAASFLVQANSMLATNQSVIIEYWHGINLPPRLIIPKSAATVLIKSGKKLTSFGYSPTSITFYFDDGAWLRTQLYQDGWGHEKEIYSILNKPIKSPNIITEMFFPALDQIAKFLIDDRIYLTPNSIKSDIDGSGASYDFSLNLAVQEVCLNYKYLKIIQPLAHTIDLAGTDGATYFTGPLARGAIAQIVRRTD